MVVMHHGMEWQDWCMTIIQYTWQKWSWRVVGCVSVPHQHIHQVKPLVLVVSHCLVLLLIDWVVDMMSQSIWVWMIHHCDTLLNATQCGHACHLIPVNQLALCDHITICAPSRLFVFYDRKHGAVCAVWSHHAFCIHSLCGMVNHHHTMIGSWWLCFIHQINSNAFKTVWLWMWC